jgi:hypothetical protein
MSPRMVESSQLRRWDPRRPSGDVVLPAGLCALNLKSEKIERESSAHALYESQLLCLHPLLLHISGQCSQAAECLL